MDKIDKIKQQLNNVPTLPGVYLWKDKDGKVIYVGKAKNLRSRMRQYVNLQDERAKIPLLVETLYGFDYVVVNNESESLILEKNLIQQYKPYFNADFKDDKSYPFIAITKGDVYPSIKYTREKHKANTRYYGPYTDSNAARKLVDITRKIVPICSSVCVDWKATKRLIDKHGIEEARKILNNKRPCFDCHVGLGPGACCNKISPEEYRTNVRKIEQFLSGNRTEFINDIQYQMKEAAKNLDFEKADRYKKRLEIINDLSDKQHIVSHMNLNADVIGIHRDDAITGVHILIVRQGRIINKNEFILNKGKDVPVAELVHNLILKYYDETTSIPHEIIIAHFPDDVQAMQNWLTEKLASKHNVKVKFSSPKKGDKYQMLKIANINAKHNLAKYKVETGYEDKKINTALLQLESALALPKSPMRIECFDISTIHGSYTVASMVVFTCGKPDKSQYRRFKIKTPLDEANDFVSMQEVMRRRYNPQKMQDKKFGSKPDLIIMDGGKPQLSAALQIFDELGIDMKKEQISIVGLAKADEELFVCWDGTHGSARPQPADAQGGQQAQSTDAQGGQLSQSMDAQGGQQSQSTDAHGGSHSNYRKPTFDRVVLPDGSESLYLVKRVRDEAHRFAITFHRELRSKGMTKSILDTVPGIGPKRKKLLLKKFGGITKLRQASLQQIMDAQVIPVDVAKELYIVLQQSNASRQASPQQD